MIGGTVDVEGESSWLERAPAEARSEYRRHRFAMNAPHDVSTELEHIFNFSVQGDADLVETVQNQIRNIFQQQNVWFLLNFSVGMILQNIETEEYRYFFPNHNTHVIQLPAMIRDVADFHSLLEHVKNMDRSNSK